MKRLIVNADDFGFTAGVNAGILEAHRRGIVSAATLMADGEAFDDAVRLARAHPGLDVGCHLVLVQGPGLPATVAALLRAVALGRIRPYEVMRAQLERILAAGLRPTHLDTHKHTHLLPPVLDAVARLSQEYGIAWVRRPFDLPLTAGSAPLAVRAAARCLGLLRGRFHSVLERHGCRTTDHFAGFQLTGRFRTAQLVALIRALPEGVTEFMCHPGHCTEALRRAPTRLKESREEELRALVADETRQALEDCRVELANYAELTRVPASD